MSLHYVRVYEHPSGHIAVCRCGWRSRPQRILHGWMPGNREVARGRAEVKGREHLRKAVMA